MTAISALKKYGLLDESADGLKITADALTALVEGPSSPERARVLVKLATTPELFAEIQASYPGPVPSDEILRSWLLRKGFLQSTVDLPIRAYRETMELAQEQKSLYANDSASSAVRHRPQCEEEPDRLPPEVGDLIQWEVSGAPQIEAPRRVRAKNEHDGAWWVFVEGSQTGIPMDEAVVVERKVPDGPPAKQPPILPLTPQVPAIAASEGEREWLRGTLSKERAISFRLIVTGDIGAKEVGKLIKVLETQKMLLEDEDDVV